MKPIKVIFFLQILLCNFIAKSQSILVKGDPLTKADPNLIQFRFAPGDWQNTYNRIVVDGVIYNFYEQSGFAPLNNINGSAFFNQEWKKATIRLKDGKDLPGQDIIYLVSYQLMFWKVKDANGKVEYKILDANSINGVLFEDENGDQTAEFVPGFFDFNGQRYVVYFQLLGDGKGSLVKYHRRKVEFEYEYNNPAGKQSFVPQYEYYTIGADGNWVLINPAEFKSQIAQLHITQKADIEQWFQKNSFNVRKEKDLLTFFNWLRQQD